MSKLDEEIKDILADDIVMNRAYIFDIAKSVDPSFQETRLRYIMEKLMESGTIVRKGRNCYVKGNEENKETYRGMYSDRANELMQAMASHFPLLDFQVWELRWLNEFLNHLTGKNIIFLDTENSGCEFVYEELRDKYDGEILVKPNPEELYRYGKDGTIVISRLVTEAPKGAVKGSVPLEKIMVELEANKVLRSLINSAEVPDLIVQMYDSYLVDNSKLLRYARRRNKQDVMLEILGDRITNGGNAHDK